MEAFAACFEKLEDPRRGNAGRHDLLEILMIAICAVLCGGQTAVDMAEFGGAKKDFLSRFMKLEHGIPSHDTFSRVFRYLDPEQFRACFIGFMARFAEATRGVIAIDGKTLRHSFDTASATSALHMVSAWGCEQRLVLGQLATEAKSNEITAVPKLLELLMLEGTIVTVDAMNCQRDTAQRIIGNGGDYVFALKANQETLYDDVRLFSAGVIGTSTSSTSRSAMRLVILPAR
jgi:predicted transposase YbfD/YdcC